MKKLLVLLVAALFAVTGVAATGCNQGEKEILVVMRENGSGTREAFEKVVKKGDVSLNDIVMGALPMLIIDIAMIALLCVFPGLALGIL